MLELVSPSTVMFTCRAAAITVMTGLMVNTTIATKTASVFCQLLLILFFIALHNENSFVFFINRFTFFLIDAPSKKQGPHLQPSRSA